MKKRVRLTARNRKAAEADLYPGTVNQPNREFEPRKKYDNYTETPGWDTPELDEPWKDDERDSIGFPVFDKEEREVARQAKVIRNRRVAAKAVKLALFLLGDKVPEKMVESQACDFMSLGERAIDASLKRYASTVSLYAEDEKEEEDEKKEASVEGEKKAEDEKSEDEEKKEASVEAEKKAEDEKEEEDEKKEASVEGEKKAEDEKEEEDEKKEASVDSGNVLEAIEKIANMLGKTLKSASEEEDKDAACKAEDEDEEKKEASVEAEKKAEDEKEEDEKKEAAVTAEDESEGEEKEAEDVDDEKQASTMMAELGIEMSDLEDDETDEATEELMASLYGEDEQDKADDEIEIELVDEEEQPAIEASKKTAKKKGAKSLGGQPKIAAASEEDLDLSKLWKGAPDVSAVFG